MQEQLDKTKRSPILGAVSDQEAAELCRTLREELIRDRAVVQPRRGLLRDRKAMVKQEASTGGKGSGFGEMNNRGRALLGEKPISIHLDYGEPDEGQKRWLAFLETGVLHEPEADCRPDLFLSDVVWKKKVEETIEAINRWDGYDQ